MQLLDTDITKFQALYKAHMGVELDHQVAREKLAKLVRQVEIVYRPVACGQNEAVRSQTEKGNAK